MSIIIGRKSNDRCSILTDTKVSIISDDDTVTGYDKMRVSPLKGILKSYILYPKVCVSLAGDVETACRIIRKFLETKPQTVEHILSFFYEELKKEYLGSQTEFLIALSDGKFPYLYKITTDIVESVNTAWLGDFRAFNDYQKAFHSRLSAGDIDGELGAMSLAFEDLLETSNVSTIGDFSIGVRFSSVNSAFLYEERVRAYRPKSITLKAKETKVIDEGKIGEGSYIISNLISNSVGYQKVALFFDQANFGLYFDPLLALNNGGRGILYKAQSRGDFVKQVKDVHDVDLIGIEFSNGKISVSF